MLVLNGVRRIVISIALRAAYDGADSGTLGRSRNTAAVRPGRGCLARRVTGRLRRRCAALGLGGSLCQSGGRYEDR